MNDNEFGRNVAYNKILAKELRDKICEVEKGGGQKAVDKLHKKGKMSARERIAYLFDDDKTSLEIGAFAADEMYLDHGGCPSAGVVVRVGNIKDVKCIVVASDASIKSGAWFPMTAKKNLRAQEIAIENKIPIIYLVDSAGVYLPLQDEVFPDKEHFGRIFRNSAVMSSRGITQIAAVMGSCVAGGAYLPIMSDEAIIVKGTGSVFLAGSYLVKAAIGEIVDNETLGGSHTHCKISGVTDYEAENDRDALDRIKSIVSKLGKRSTAGFNRATPQPPKSDSYDIYGVLPDKRSKVYDMRSILDCIIDDCEFEEYKKDYGKTLLTAYARIDGWAVGIVANRRQVVKNARGEMQIGGVIYSDSADKATRFIANCNQKRIPLVFLQDVTGFMVGSQSEHGGIIKDGAKMVNAVANSVVPKFTVIVGNSYGAGNYAMCGKAYDSRLILSWPGAEIAVMGAQQAAEVMLEMEISKMKKKGKTLTDREKKTFLKRISENYKKQSCPYYAAARLWVDAVIDPIDTRRWISNGIQMADQSPIEKSFNMGILQT